MKVFAARGLKFCRSEYVFAGPGGEPYTNQAFSRNLGRACKDLRLSMVLSAHGLRHRAATILLNDQGKKLGEVQEALRHRDIRTTARYAHVAPEHYPRNDGRARREPACAMHGSFSKGNRARKRVDFRPQAAASGVHPGREPPENRKVPRPADPGTPDSCLPDVLRKDSGCQRWSQDRMAWGFRNFVYFKTAAYHRAGQLHLDVPNMN
jgi:hypothetical protein